MPPVVDEDGWITSAYTNDDNDDDERDVLTGEQDAIEYPADDSSTVTSVSSSQSVAYASGSPSKARKRPAALRMQSAGVDPRLLVGKVLKHVRRSSNHPAITLSFSDETSYQILVDGYDPRHPGVPKILDMDDMLRRLFDPPEGLVDVDLVIMDCCAIKLSDKAFAMEGRGQRWDQSHSGIAFKFEEGQRWHCVWAMLEERDAELGRCIFRSYDDVYLKPLANRSPHTPRRNKFNKARKQDNTWRN